MDYSGILYDPIYAAFGIAATLTPNRQDPAEGAITVIERTTTTDASEQFELGTLRPGAFVRRRALDETGIADGIRRALEIAAIARVAGIEVYGGCMFETSIAHAAGAHLMAAVPDLLLGCEFYMSAYYAEADLAEVPFPVKKVSCTYRPELGVRREPEMLTRYRRELIE